MSAKPASSRGKKASKAAAPAPAKRSGRARKTRVVDEEDDDGEGDDAEQQDNGSEAEDAPVAAPKKGKASRGRGKRVAFTGSVTVVRGGGTRSLPQLTIDELKGFDVDKLEYEIQMLEARRDELKTTANLKAIAEYRKKEAEYKARLAELEEISAERDSARCVRDGLVRQRAIERAIGLWSFWLCVAIAGASLRRCGRSGWTCSWPRSGVQLNKWRLSAVID